MKKIKHSFIERFQLTVFTLTFIVSAIFIFCLLCWLLQSIPVIAIVIISLIYLLSTIIVWSYLYVLFSIPSNLSRKFDRIKNEIASGKIKAVKEFSTRFCTFLIEFYNFSFFDIEHAAIKIRDTDHCFSSQDFWGCLDWNLVENILMQSEELLFHGKVLISDKNYFGYSIPIIFGEEFLGYFTVFTPRRLGKLMQRLLIDLENDFVDDQLVHIMRRELENS